MMNEIKNKILEPFFIKNETYGISIYEEVIPTIGQPYIRYVSHHDTIENCLLKITQYKVHNKVQYNSVREYIDAYKDYQEKIKTIKYD